MYTVGTEEYESLPIAIAGLQAEGVDVSYFIANLEEKGVQKALKEYLLKVMGDRKEVNFPELLTSSGRQKANEAISDYLEGRSDLREAYTKMNRFLGRLKIHQELWKLIMGNKLAYYLNPAVASETLFIEILTKLLGGPSPEYLHRGDPYLLIKLGEIPTILASKSVQAMHSVVIPWDEVIKKLGEVAPEISREFRRSGLNLRIRSTWRPTYVPSEKRKTFSANLKVEVEVSDREKFSEDLIKYLGLKVDLKEFSKVVLKFKVSSLRIYGFSKWPFWEHRTDLDSEGFRESAVFYVMVGDVGEPRAHYKCVNPHENQCNYSNLSDDYLKFLLTARYHTLVVLRAFNKLVEVMAEGSGFESVLSTVT